MAERSQGSVCGLQLAGVAGSNPAGGIMSVLYSKELNANPAKSGKREKNTNLGGLKGVGEWDSSSH